MLDGKIIIIEESKHFYISVGNCFVIDILTILFAKTVKMDPLKNTALIKFYFLQRKIFCGMRQMIRKFSVVFTVKNRGPHSRKQLSKNSM